MVKTDILCEYNMVPATNSCNFRQIARVRGADELFEAPSQGLCHCWCFVEKFAQTREAHGGSEQR